MAWREPRYPVPEGHVQIGPAHAVSPGGDVYSLIYGRNLKPGMGTNGRRFVNIRVFGDDRVVPRGVHALVCTAFHGPRPPGLDASHVNGDKSDNRASNLVWETRKENFARKVEHGTSDIGVANSRAHLNTEQLDKIFDLREDGLKHEDIATEIGCSRVMVTKVLNGHRYRDHYEKRRKHEAV